MRGAPTSVSARPPPGDGRPHLQDARRVAQVGHSADPLKRLSPRSRNDGSGALRRRRSATEPRLASPQPEHLGSRHCDPGGLALEDVPGLAYARAGHGCNSDRRDCCVARWMRQGRAELTLASAARVACCGRMKSTESSRRPAAAGALGAADEIARLASQCHRVARFCPFRRAPGAAGCLHDPRSRWACRSPPMPRLPMRPIRRVGVDG
jgi:hypothetical protein